MIPTYVQIPKVLYERISNLLIRLGWGPYLPGVDTYLTHREVEDIDLFVDIGDWWIPLCDNCESKRSRRCKRRACKSGGCDDCCVPR